MASRKTLTNEALKKNFVNPFDLVNLAIAMAAELVSREEDHEYNPANRVLEMIVRGQELPARVQTVEESES
jgi:hypothetical protein